MTNVEARNARAEPSVGPRHSGGAASGAGRAEAWRWWKPALIFLAVAAVVWLVTFVAAETLPREYLYPRPDRYRGGPLVEMWFRWDAGWYREIVRHGYRYYPGVQSSVAYFPAYPLAIAAVSWAFPSIPAAAVAVTFSSGLASAILFHRWCSARLTPAAATTSLLVLLVSPYAWYLFGAVYSDAFFLLVVVAAFLLVERRNYWLAGVVGFVATASRPTGIAVAIGLVLVVLERAYEARVAADPSAATPGSGPWWRRLIDGARHHFDPRGFSWRAAPVLLSFGGLAAWAGYLWARFGDPLLFVHIESTWWQGAGPRTWFKVAFVEEIPTAWHSIFATSLILHAAIGVAAVLLVPRIARRFGWAYAAYVLVVMGIPVIGTKDFMSNGRYALAAFPAVRPRRSLAHRTADGDARVRGSPPRRPSCSPSRRCGPWGSTSRERGRRTEPSGALSRAVRAAVRPRHRRRHDHPDVPPVEALPGHRRSPLPHRRRDHRGRVGRRRRLVQSPMPTPGAPGHVSATELIADLRGPDDLPIYRVQFHAYRDRTLGPTWRPTTISRTTTSPRSIIGSSASTGPHRAARGPSPPST